MNIGKEVDAHLEAITLDIIMRTLMEAYDANIKKYLSEKDNVLA